MELRTEAGRQRATLLTNAVAWFILLSGCPCRPMVNEIRKAEKSYLIPPLTSKWLFVSASSDKWRHWLKCLPLIPSFHHITEIAGCDSLAILAPSISIVEDLGVELASKSSLEQMQELESEKEGCPESVYNDRTKQIMQKLGSILPGATDALAEMLDPDTDRTVTKPHEMASLLDKHRRKVLGGKPTDFSRLHEWLGDSQANLPPFGDKRWDITSNHISVASSTVKNPRLDLMIPHTWHTRFCSRCPLASCSQQPLTWPRMTLWSLLRTSAMPALPASPKSLLRLTRSMARSLPHPRHNPCPLSTLTPGSSQVPSGKPPSRYSTIGSVNPKGDSSLVAAWWPTSSMLNTAIEYSLTINIAALVFFDFERDLPTILYRLTYSPFTLRGKLVVTLCNVARVHLTQAWRPCAEPLGTLRGAKWLPTPLL